MPSRLSTTVSKINLFPNPENAALFFKFHEFMKENGVSERHQNNNLKAVVAYATKFLDLTQKPFKDVDSKEMVLSFLNTKIKTKEEDPEQKWITTYNDYLHRIKHFLGGFTMRTGVFRWICGRHLPF